MGTETEAGRLRHASCSTESLPETMKNYVSTQRRRQLEACRTLRCGGKSNNACSAIRNNRQRKESELPGGERGTPFLDAELVNAVEGRCGK